MADSANEEYLNDQKPRLSEESAKASTYDEGIWSAVKEALRGSHRNYTEGSIGRSIFLLAIPMVLEMIMEQSQARLLFCPISGG